MSGGSEEKTLPPSFKKLRDARQKGQISKSKEMTTAAVTLAAFGYLMLTAPALFGYFADLAVAAARATDQPVHEAVALLAGRMLAAGESYLGPLLLLLVVTGVLANIVVNGGLVISMDPVAPKLERIDPVKGFGRLFAMRNWIELIKTLLKLLLVLGCCFTLERGALRTLMHAPGCGVGCVGPVLRGMLVPLLVTCCGFFVLLGLMDIGLQRWLFRREMRMTKTEQKRERKEMEGDPFIKKAHRTDQRTASRTGLRTGMRNATFVVRSSDIVLAFRYAKPDAEVPVLLARATDDAVPQLANEAKRLGLPIVFNPAAAQALVGRVLIGKAIPPGLFQVVITCMREAGLL